MTASDTIRKNLVEHVAMLADADAQLRYEREVSHVPVYVELIESFCDSYSPGDSAFEAAFSTEEKSVLTKIDRTLEACPLTDVHSVADLLATVPWQSIVQQAREALIIFAKNA